MNVLEKRQVVAASAKKVWRFLSSPKNLDEITPPNLSFHIVSELPEEMYDGLLIQYKVKIPVFGERDWLTEIKHIRPGISFVDEQRSGPYKFWYHYHEIRPEGRKTVMIDRVTYELPYSLVGDAARVLFVKRMLEGIFEFRRKILANKFGQ